MYHDINVRSRLPMTLQDMFLVPEEFELPSISLKKYIDLNAPFYPNFSKEDMYKYLHCFEMDMDVNLGSTFYGAKKESIYEFCFSYQYFSFIDG